MPLLVFLSFAAGVLLTLALQGMSPQSGPKIQRVRDLVEGALRRDAEAVNELQRSTDLKDALERIRDALGSEARPPAEKE